MRASPSASYHEREMERIAAPLNLISERVPEGTRWQLPSRPWGAARFMPWIFIAVGIAIAAIFGITNTPTLPNFNDDAADAIFDLIGLLMQAIPSLIGLALVLTGFILMRARTTITLAGSQLQAADHFGPLRWTRKINTAHLTGFEINVGTSSTNGGPKKPTNNVTFLIAHTNLPARIAKQQGAAKDAKRDFIVAWAYPKGWMQELADLLADNIEYANPQLEGLEITTTMGSSEPGDLAETETRVDPPGKTRIILQQETDGLTFTIPPAGIMRGSKGLGCFAVIWNGFIFIMIVGMVLAMLNSDKPNVSGPDSPWVLLFFLPFIAVGVGMAWYSVHAGKSHASVVVIGTGDNAVLAYYRNSPVRKPRELNWAIADLSHIRVGDSNLSINDQPIQELHIHPKQGKKVGLLSQLEDEELRWIAYELRRQTGLPRHATHDDEV